MNNWKELLTKFNTYSNKYWEDKKQERQLSLDEIIDKVRKFMPEVTKSYEDSIKRTNGVHTGENIDFYNVWNRRLYQSANPRSMPPMMSGDTILNNRTYGILDIPEQLRDKKKHDEYMKTLQTKKETIN